MEAPLAEALEVEAPLAEAPVAEQSAKVPVVKVPVVEQSARAPVVQAPVVEQSARASAVEAPRRDTSTERDEVTDRASTDEVTVDLPAMATATPAGLPADRSGADLPLDVDVPVPGAPEDAAVEGAPDADDAESTPAPARRSPVREWAVVGAQLVGALVGGAGLWFAFRWLWEWHSVVALVLSAVVIVGLVVVVRVLRRAEDLFSTVLAVLAGLIVTVSPPVLTLTGR